MSLPTDNQRRCSVWREAKTVSSGSATAAPTAGPRAVTTTSARTATTITTGWSNSFSSCNNSSSSWNNVCCGSSCPEWKARTASQTVLTSTSSSVRLSGFWPIFSSTSYSLTRPTLAALTRTPLPLLPTRTWPIPSRNTRFGIRCVSSEFFLSSRKDTLPHRVRIHLCVESIHPSPWGKHSQSSEPSGRLARQIVPGRP